MNKIVCAIMVHKDRINFQIWRDAELRDDDNILNGSGKSMRHIQIEKPSEVKKGVISKLIKQASRLE